MPRKNKNNSRNPTMDLAYFDSVPDHIVLEILLALKPSPATLNKICLISKRFKRLAENDKLWKEFLKPHTVIPPGSSAKEVFKNNLHAVKNEYYKYARADLKLDFIKDKAKEYHHVDYNSYASLATRSRVDQKPKATSKNVFIDLFHFHKTKKLETKNSLTPKNKIIDVFHLLDPILNELDRRLEKINNGMFQAACSEKVLSKALFIVIEKYGENASIVSQPQCLLLIWDFINPEKSNPSNWQLLALADVLVDEELVTHPTLPNLLTKIIDYIRDPANKPNLIGALTAVPQKSISKLILESVIDESKSESKEEIVLR